MENFQVIQPSELLKPYIKQYWFLTLDNVIQDSQRLIPFGCCGLTFHRTSNVLSSKNNFLSRAYLLGQSTKYSDIFYSGDIDLIFIVFQPVGAMAFFKIPIDVLYNQHIPIEALEDSQIIELENRLMETRDEVDCVQLIESFLLKRLSEFEDNNHERLRAVMDAVKYKQFSIPMLAQTACLSYKQFKRIFLKNIGLNPKDYLRIIRFQKAVHLLQWQPQKTLSQLAYECDFYDKSHLIREFREFSGYNPMGYLSLCDPYSGYHALFRSAFLDLPII